MTFAEAAERLCGCAALLFGWRPHEFWASTPAELACLFAALRGDGEAAPPARGEIETLMELFPDG